MCESKVVVMPIEKQRETLQNIFTEEVSRLEGKVLTLVEVTGLQGDQLKSLKSLLRQSVWTLYDRVWTSLTSYKILEVPVYPGPFGEYMAEDTKLDTEEQTAKAR